MDYPIELALAFSASVASGTAVWALLQVRRLERRVSLLAQAFDMEHEIVGKHQTVLERLSGAPPTLRMSDVRPATGPSKVLGVRDMRRPFAPAVRHVPIGKTDSERHEEAVAAAVLLSQASVTSQPLRDIATEGGDDSSGDNGDP